MSLRETARGPELETWSPALAGVPGDLWLRIREAGRPLLLLDYDGTLAPHQVHREHAVPPHETKRQLRALVERGRTRVAIFTGRPVAEVDELLGDLPIHRVGEHGWEERAPGEELRQHPLKSPARNALEGAWKAISARGLSSRVEQKRTALVLHTRGLFPDADAALTQAAEAVWQPWTERAPLRLDRTHGGIELRARERGKGVAALELVRRLSADFVGYVGDDATDEDAFRALGEKAIGLRVGQPEEPSLARGRIRKPEMMGEFLLRWLDAEALTQPSSGARA